MPLRLTAEERRADFVVRKGRSGYWIVPISDEALRWLRLYSPHAAWDTKDGRDAMRASRDEAAETLARHAPAEGCTEVIDQVGLEAPGDRVRFERAATLCAGR